MGIKAKLSAVRTALGKLPAAECRPPGVDRWHAAIDNQIATIAAVQQRIGRLDPRSRGVSAEWVVIQQEVKRLGVTNDPEVISATLKVRRIMSVWHHAHAGGLDEERKEVLCLALKDAKGRALALLIQAESPWPGALHPPRHPRPEVVLPPWVGTLNDAELLGCVCPELSDEELADWLNELKPEETST